MKRAIVLVAMLAGALPVEAVAASTAASSSAGEMPEAQRFYREGVADFEAGQFALAEAAFRASYGLVPSPNSYLMLARSVEAQGRLAEAYSLLDRVRLEATEAAKSDPKYQATVAKAVERLANIKPRIGFVVLSGLPEGAEGLLLVGAKPVTMDRTAEPLAVDPGTVDVQWAPRGGERVSRRVSVRAGETLPVSVEPGPVAARVTLPDASESEGRDLRPYAWIGAGVSVAGVALGVTAGLMAVSTLSDLEDRCGTTDQEKQNCQGADDSRSTGESQQLLSNVGWIVAGVGAGAAVGFLIFGGPSSREKSTEVAITPSGMLVRGTF